MPFVFVLVSVFLFSSPLLAQTVVEKKSTASSTQKQAKLKDGTALFERAVAKQCNSQHAPKITSFEGQFDVKMMDHSKAKSSTKMTGRIHQFWAQRSLAVGKTNKLQTAYRRELTNDVTTEKQVMSHEWQGDPTRQTFQGKKAGKLVWLNSKMIYAKEREDLLAEKRRIGELFGLIVLRQLKVVPGSIKIVAENVDVQFKVGKLDFNFKTTKIAFSDERQFSFRLWLDQEKLNPVRAQVRWPGRKVWEQFDLAQHYETTLPDGKTKIVVPCNIVYYQNGRPLIQASANNPQDAFKFNGLDKKRLLELFPEDDDDEM